VDIGEIVRELEWVDKLLVDEVVSFGITVPRPDRIIVEPIGTRRKTPLVEARVVDQSGYSVKIADVRVLEYFTSQRLYFGKIYLTRRGEIAEVPVVLNHACEVKTDLNSTPLNVYLYLLLLADALKLPYVMWHRAYALVNSPSGRKTLFLILLLNILHSLTRLIIKLYSELAQESERTRKLTSGLDFRSEVGTVLDVVLFSGRNMSDVNNLVRNFLPVPDDLVLYVPTCEVCGRRVECFVIPGDLQEGKYEGEYVPPEELLYVSTILRCLKRCNVPILCRSCRFRLREKISKLQEQHGNKLSFEQVLKIALEELKRETKRA